MKVFKKAFLRGFGLAIIFLLANNVQAQVPTCGANVPYYLVNLTGNPGGTWVSPSHSRNDNCCGTVSPDRCTSFEIILDPLAAQINFEIASGAIPTGSMFYQINCGPQTPVGQPICITGPGPHYMTFCKPGNNQNTYKITSIPQPIFPPNTSTRRGCNKPLTVQGMQQSSITWTSISPGVVGQYDALLSCTSNCATATFTPTATSPAVIQYRICGTPTASICGFNYQCGTVTVTTYDYLTATVTPNPAYYCAGGPGVLLTANPIGGNGVYTYIWKNSSGTTLGTGSTYTATTNGTYTLEVRDGLYDPTRCGGAFVSVPVNVIQPPTANAGTNFTVCSETPSANISGSSTNYASVSWSGGSGTYSPNNTSLNFTYTPTAGEIASGSATLTMTSIALGGGCSNATSNITITYNPAVLVNIPPQVLLCYEDITVITANASGGTGPYTYLWNTAETTASINAIVGSYSVTVTDNLGCTQNTFTTVTAPAPLTVLMSGTDATTNGGTDGTATATPSGGTSPYTYLWSDLQTTQTAVGLGVGSYSVTITDNNGCSVTGSVLVNEPQCTSFGATTSSIDVSCNGFSNGMAIATVFGGVAPYSYLWDDPLTQANDTAFNLAAGTYTVTITDNVNCLAVVTQIINQPNILVDSISSIDVAFFGGSTGSATSHANGGTLPYGFLWSTIPLQTDSTATGLTAGIYYVTVTDANGCIFNDSIEIKEPDCSGFIASIDSIDATCFGSNDGSAIANGHFGASPFTYLWSNAQTSQTAIGLSPGSYSATITDSLNCSAVSSVIIAEPTALQVSFTNVDVSCNGSNSGSIDLTVSGGTFPYFFLWSNGSITEDISLLTAGNYSVTVTDNNGCSTLLNITMNEPPAITYSYTKTDITCQGDSTGSIDITISGGVTPYSFLWSNGETTEDLSNLLSAQYFLVITDANNCQLSTFPDVILDQPDSLEFLSVSVACPTPGNNFASVTVTPYGGNGPYQISFDNGSTFLAPGDYIEDLPINSTYNAIIKDVFSCVSSVPYTFSINPGLTLSTSNISFNTCYSSGTTTETVTVTPQGGNGGPYLVSFNNGASFQALGDYDAALPINNNYIIIVMDTSGCLSPSVSITLPNIFSISSVISGFVGGFNVTCNGSTNGNINLTTSGGAAPYTYLWNTLATTEDISNLGAGLYSVTIIDSNSCQIDTSFTITEPTLLTVGMANGASSNLCFGNCNASAIATPIGGVGPFSFLWDDTLSQTTATAVGLCAGNYSVMVSDVNGCDTTVSIIITEPTPISASIATNPSTCGACNGDATATPSGGTSSYTFNWLDNTFASIGQTSSTATSLCAGSYYVEITDANNCVDTFSFSISNIGAETVSTVSTDALCFSSCDGQIEANFICNDPPCIIEWYELTTGNLLSFTDTLATNLCNGKYSIHVINNSNCLSITVDAINQPQPIIPNAIINQSSCFGSNSGSISLSPSGGTGSYNYLWSANAGSSTNSSVTNLAPGNYSVIITDSVSCDTTYSFLITEPTEIVVLKDSANASCNNVCDGMASVSVNGGVFPYTYLWSNGNTDTLTNGLCNGNYSVNILDKNGCSNITSFIITEPQNLSGTISVVDALCFGSCNGQATVSATGGTAPYSYLWDSFAGNQSTATATGLCSGIYSVNISDTNGCDTNISVVINQPQALSATMSSTAVICNGECNGIATATVIGGVGNYTYVWNDPLSQTSSTAITLCADTFTVSITDSNLCNLIMPIVITQPQPISVTLFENDIFCNGDNTGAAAVLVNGGNGSYTYLWSNGDTTGSTVNLDTGTYNVIITDLLGCDTNLSATINEPQPLSATINPISSTCGICNGSSTFIASGGTPGYTYDWMDATFNPIPHSDTIATGLCAGLYNVYLTDTNYCVSLFPLSIIDIGSEAISIATTNESCFETCDGTALASTACIDGPCAFEWFDYSTGLTTGQTNPLATSLCGGVYFVQVTNNSGCISVLTDTINPATPILANQLVTDVTCFGSCNGIINLFPSGGQPTYTYLWDALAGNSTSSSVSSLCPNTYSVTITDSIGCDSIYSFTISEPPALNINYTTVDATCVGLLNGSIDITVTGGTPNYSYLWSNSSISEDISGLSGGTYVVVVTDMNNCVDSTSIIVNENLPFNITLSQNNIDCFGNQNGSITSSVSGGSSPYSYLWSTLDTTQSITGLGSGWYILVVEDSIGCSNSDSIEILEPALLDATINSPLFPNGHNISFYHGNDGSATVYVIGGTSPYAYQWSNGSNASTLSNLSSGTYNVIITDFNGCSIGKEVILTQPNNLEMPTGYTPNGDGSNDFFVIQGIEAYPENNFLVYNRWGNLVYEKENYNNEWKGENKNGDNLPDATYYVILTIKTANINLTGYVDLRR